MKNIFPDKLLKIEKYLIDMDFKLSKRSKDGRVNSAFNEDEILKIIQNNFEINIPRKRDWWDFSFEENNIFYPVNIKITETTKNDNLNCKMGIYYCLTGMIPDFGNEINWDSYFQKLKENIGKSKNRDYYFLVINKSDKTIFLQTLSSLNKLIPNGNNLPFQCKWDDNKKIIKRNFEERISFILQTFSQSIKLRAKILSDFKKYFKEYL